MARALGGRHETLIEGADAPAMADSIQRLHLAISLARQSDPRISRTAKLFAEGLPKMAKKVGEEAVEVGIEAVLGRRDALVSESADLLYNLVALWSAMGIAPADIWAELDRREGLYGIAEKLRKPRPGKHRKRVMARIEPADAA